MQMNNEDRKLPAMKCRRCAKFKKDWHRTKDGYFICSKCKSHDEEIARKVRQ